MSRVLLVTAMVISGSALALITALPGSATALPSRRIGQAPRIAPAALRLGTLANSTELNVDVELRPRDPAALADYATAVSTPGNRLYEHYLARGEFANVFGPTQAAISAVTQELRSDGLQPGPISSNHLIIPVRASATQLQKAFSIGFEQYRLPGRVAYANTQAPLLSGSAASYVLGVAGLDDLYLPHALDLRKPQATPRRSATPRVVTGGPQPCSTAVTDAPDNDAYTADQIASAYNFSSLYGAGDEGAGITVALFELEPDLTSDIAAYQSCYGTSATVNYIEEDGGAGSGAGSGEAALDIEDIIGLAPLATIDVYQAPNSGTGLIDNYTAIVDKDTAQVVSTSWGLCESEAGSAILSEEATLFEQAATQGQSVFAAAGDNGSTDCQTNSLAVDDPGSQPYVTSVGGTTLSALGPPPSETVWNESSNGAGAGGGGISSLNTMPSYQSSAPPSLKVINANSSGSPCGAAPGSYCREVPDVSANADPYTGYLIYYEGSWTGIGGTSAAAPLWAAYSALVDASSACGGKRVGFANPALYDAAASHYSSDYHDITSGNNDYTPEGYDGGLYPAGSGYDMASGLGTPNGGNLAGTLCGEVNPPDTVTVTNPGSQTTTVGASVSLQIKAKDSGGAALSFSAAGLPLGLSISTSGLVTGTPTTAGPNSVSVTAKDKTGVSGSTSFTWAVDPASASETSLSLSAASVSLESEELEKFTVTVSGKDPGGPGLVPTGKVHVTATSGKTETTLCTVTLVEGTRSCSLTTSQLPAGTWTVLASYPGDTSFNASTSANATLTVVSKFSSTATIKLSADPITFGREQIEKFTFTVRGSSALVPTGKVAVKSGKTTLCTATLASGRGSCSPSTSLLSAGKHSIVAVYAGDANFLVSTSTPSSLTIAPAESSTTLKLSATTVTVGREQVEKFTVTVRGSSAFPAGKVAVKSGKTTLCTATLASGRGSCSPSTSVLAAGKHSIVAVYAGDANFLASTSTSSSLTVNRAAGSPKHSG
jgi:hypothetical protein